MKHFHILALMAFVLIFSACSASKKVVNPFVGSWNYVVKNTPMGDVGGELVITESEGAYTGIMLSDQGTLDLTNIMIEGNKLSSDIDFEGTLLKLEAMVEGTLLNGTIYSEFGDFPVSGNKKEL